MRSFSRTTRSSAAQLYHIWRCRQKWTIPVACSALLVLLVFPRIFNSRIGAKHFASQLPDLLLTKFFFNSNTFIKKEAQFFLNYRRIVDSSSLTEGLFIGYQTVFPGKCSLSILGEKVFISNLCAFCLRLTIFYFRRSTVSSVIRSIVPALCTNTWRSRDGGPQASLP